MMRRGNDADAETGAGERAERSRRQRRWALFGSLFLLGVASGVYVGHSGGDFEALIGPDPVMPAAAAIAISAAILIAVAIGSVLLRPNMDEHEKLTQYKAAAVAGSAFLITYLVWFNLWKGGVLPEPHHLVLFLGFLVAKGLGFVYYRFR